MTPDSDPNWIMEDGYGTKETIDKWASWCYCARFLKVRHPLLTDLVNPRKYSPIFE